MGRSIQYTKGSEMKADAPLRRGFSITPGASELNTYTRAIMVSVDCTVTGIMVDDTASHTTVTLKAGGLYPLCFKVISAVTNSATIVGYA